MPQDKRQEAADATVWPVILIAAHTLRVLQQVTFAKNRRLDEILIPEINLYKEEIAKLQDELYLCPFLQLIIDMDNTSDLQGETTKRREIIALMSDITHLSPQLSRDGNAARCLRKLVRLYDLSAPTTALG